MSYRSRWAQLSGIEAQSISYAYHRREKLVLEHVSAAFKAGEMTAIVGPSGSGKSTFLYILAGLLTPSWGKVMLADTSLYELGDVERSALRASHFGFVFQDFVLDPRRTLLDNIVEPCLGAGIEPRDYLDRARDLAIGLGVSERLEAKPPQISGGQAQRIALARALLLQPSVIFADEPTGNLDAESADTVLSTLAHVAADGKTVIIVTHDDRVMAYCDRLVRLR